MALTGELLEIRAGDGYLLGATLFRPAMPNGRAVQVHSAAGVKQQYYAGFAAYLASRGFTALTFDYRGVGRSARSELKGTDARMRDWAQLDAPAVLDFLRFNFKGEANLAVGHSFGGQSFAVMPGNDRFSAVLAVASQSCYWKHWHGLWRLGMWVLVRALLPAATRACGYFPGAILRQGENLPAEVALEWARWCRHPQYLVGALGAGDNAGRMTARLRLCWVADDFYAPREAAKGLLALYPNARHELVQVVPAELGVERVGHFGFFRERFRDSLWQDAADWLEKDG